MSEKVVLPKFDLPGQGPHPAIRVLQVAGGLMGAALLVLGVAMWRHHSMQVAAEARAQALIATRAAEAAAAIEAAKAREAEAAAKIVAAKAAKEAAKLAAAEAAKASAAEAANSASSSSKSKSRHHAKAGGKGAGKAVAAAAKTEDKKPSGSKRDDAAIDKLLASFK